MVCNLGHFPFGQLVQKLSQKDQTQKKVFVLGVYASAVHARWVGVDNKVIVKALAVDSEPEIIWSGKGAVDIVSKIVIPPEAGKFECPEAQFNGPSGTALNERILKPLGFVRREAWLCDLVPYSCRNKEQNKAIEQKYNPLAKRLGLPEATTLLLPSPLVDLAKGNLSLKGWPFFRISIIGSFLKGNVLSMN
jgi:hypothetical protein